MSDLSELIQKEEAPITPLRRLYDVTGKCIDYKMGALGGGAMASIVGIINADYGLAHASVAAVKQGAYSFLAGAFFMRICQSIAQKGRNTAIAITLSVLTPSAVTIGATYSVHTLKGTPKPIDSTIPTALLSPPAFLYWGLRKRKEIQTSQVPYQAE